MKARDFFKRKEEKMNCIPSDVTTANVYWQSDFISLAPTPSQDQYEVPCQEVKAANSCREKGNNPMYVDNDKHIESSKINYLNDRLESLAYRKQEELMRKFGLSNDNAPTTPNELVKRIQDGKYVISSDKGDVSHYDIVRYIQWRDPAVKKDQLGYNAAIELFTTARREARDTIAIGTPAEGLAAVKALDAWTPTVGTA